MMATLTDFTAPANKPRLLRPRPPFGTIMLSHRLRLALASLALAQDPHVPAAAQQVQAALDQVEGSTL